MSGALHVELMRTLDEKFIADPVAFATMRPTAAVVVDGAPLRDATGAIDIELVRALVERATWQFPPMRLRLRPMPWGVTTPAWVAAEDVDLDYHLRFLDRPPADESAALAGDSNGDLDAARPLWVILVVPLANGDIALVPQVQHALGDGLFGLRVIDALSKNEPFDASDGDADRVPVRSPRTRAGILIEALRGWWRLQGGLRAAWREYSRKSFRRRLRRTGGRILRPFRARRRPPVALPPRHHAFATFALADAKRAARAIGSSLHDLTVASALQAVEAGLGGEGPVALLVPVSRRAGSTGDERNNISMVRVAVPRGLELPEIAASVHQQVAAAAAADILAPPPNRDWPGYASFLPWRPRRRYIGQALVRSVILWPVLDPGERVAVFGSTYHEAYTVAVSGTDDLDVPGLLARTCEAFLTAEQAS
jgi:hypothetical protein